MPEPTPASPHRSIALTRKTDFCFSYSCFDPYFLELYARLGATNILAVSHIIDNCTQRLGLFSGIEVKLEKGDLKEVELQISIWMVVSLRKKIELGRLAFPVYGVLPAASDIADNETSSTEHFSAVAQPFRLIEPALTIIGNEHKVYYSFPANTEGDIRVLGPDERFAHLTTRSVQGIFKLARFYGRMLEWGVGENGLWGTFLGPVLKTLAEAS